MTVRRQATERLEVVVYVYDPPMRIGAVTCARNHSGSWTTPQLNLERLVDGRAWEAAKPAIDAAFAEIMAAMAGESE